MKDTIIIMRYSHGAIGLTGWGWALAMILLLLVALSRPHS